MSDLNDRLRAMPSSLNDALRTMEEAAKRIDELERVIALSAEYLGKHASRRTVMLSQSSWMPKRSTVEADRNACLSAKNTLRAVINLKAGS